MTSETITLKYPITVSGATVTEIEVRRPKWKDITATRKSDKDEISQTEALMMALCSTPIAGGLTPDDLAELDIMDMTAIAEKIEGFTKKLK